MAVKSKSQVSLIDLTDAYSVFMSNEAHTFTGNTSGAVNATQTATTAITGYCGNDQMVIKIGTITNPTGISHTISNNNSLNPSITFTATTSCTAAGTVTVPVEIGDITINKTFSYTIAKTGATGVSVSSTTIHYVASTSGTSIPTSGWQTTIPTVPQGQYLWTRVEQTMSNSTKNTSYSVSYQAADGAAGANGNDGKGIKSQEVTYQVGTSGTTAPTGTWSSSVPTLQTGKYLWTRTITTYTDNTTKTTYSVAYSGTNGSNGADAITMTITSSNGTIFKNTAIATVLTAQVFKGGVEVTGNALTALGSIKWYKDGNSTAVATGQTLTISAGDIDNQATYVAQLEG